MASPKAYIPLDACASGPVVLACRSATAATATRRAIVYPPATTATLWDGFMSVCGNFVTWHGFHAASMEYLCGGAVKRE